MADTQALAGCPGRANLPPELVSYGSRILFIDARCHMRCHLLMSMAS